MAYLNPTASPYGPRGSPGPAIPPLGGGFGLGAPAMPALTLGGGALGAGGAGAGGALGGIGFGVQSPPQLTLQQQQQLAYQQQQQQQQAAAAAAAKLQQQAAAAAHHQQQQMLAAQQKAQMMAAQQMAAQQHATQQHAAQQQAAAAAAAAGAGAGRMGMGAAPAAMGVNPAVAAAAAGPIFGMSIAGRPFTTDFKQIDNKKMVTEVVAPALVHDLSINLLRPVCPPGHAVAIFYALPPYKEWQLVGSVSNESRTTFLKAPWHGKIPPQTASVQLGLSIEPQSVFANLRQDHVRGDDTLDDAKAIATHLYNHIASFSQKTQQNDVLVMPANCINEWFEKFKAKHRVTPYFWMDKSKTQ